MMYLRYQLFNIQAILLDLIKFLPVVAGPADDPAFQDPVIGFFSCATAQFGGPNAKK
jgi:hypothetical protein